MILDLGIASYRNPEKLAATLRSIQQNSVNDLRVWMIHNPSDDDAPTRAVIESAMAGDKRIRGVWMDRNVGYAGAVNELLRVATSPFVLYCDNDIEILTPGWDQKMLATMEADDRLGICFPNGGHRQMGNECFWNAGFCWMLRRDVLARLHKQWHGDWASYYYGRNQKRPNCEYDSESGWIVYRCCGMFDEHIGHHEEVDYCIRLRLAGYRIGSAVDVEVKHHESSTRSKESEYRIHDGVVRWMNKWNNYFVGEQVDYSKGLRCENGEGNTKYGDDAIQMDAWNVSGPYMERFYKRFLNGLNAAPEMREVPGVGTVDLIKVPRPMDWYRSRVI
jgi:hypothetical protein